MKRPLRYRTMGAVREGRGNPSPYSICGQKLLTWKYRNNNNKVFPLICNYNTNIRAVIV